MQHIPVPILLTEQKAEPGRRTNRVGVARAKVVVEAGDQHLATAQYLEFHRFHLDIRPAPEVAADVQGGPNPGHGAE